MKCEYKTRLILAHYDGVEGRWTRRDVAHWQPAKTIHHVRGWYEYDEERPAMWARWHIDSRKWIYGDLAEMLWPTIWPSPPEYVKWWIETTTRTETMAA